jgi:hypothetical protein
VRIGKTVDLESDDALPTVCDRNSVLLIHGISDMNTFFAKMVPYLSGLSGLVRSFNYDTEQRCPLYQGYICTQRAASTSDHTLISR